MAFSCAGLTAADPLGLDLVSAETRGNPDVLTVTFTVPVDAATATDPANYTVSPGVTVQSVTLIETAKVRLLTSTMAGGVPYQLSLGGITDTASPSHPLTPTTVTFLQTQGGITRREFYDLGSSGLLSALTRHAKFTGNKPDVSVFTTSLEPP